MATMPDIEIKLRVKVEVETQDAANLGLATTRQMLTELKARGDEDGVLYDTVSVLLKQLDIPTLNYRPVDH